MVEVRATTGCGNAPICPRESSPAPDDDGLLWDLRDGLGALALSTNYGTVQLPVVST
jgi:hypothetical protein